MPAELSLEHRELYREVRQFLLDLFPDATQQIVQGFQNNSPLPNNAVVMQILLDRNMDETSTYYTPAEDKAHAQNSVNARLQLDFYGPLAESRSRTVNGLWKSYYGADNMSLCQPLYVHSRDRRPYINDSNMYEDRWILDLALQYNPQVTYAQDFADSASVTVTPVGA